MSLAASARITPLDIATALADGGAVRAPTDEQSAVITADATPSLVVAGAGSGKTETMSMRVLWLLANGFAEPADILGLTFTKKAAGELRERLLQRIGQLMQAGMIPRESLELASPVVATYNSYANQIFREHALVIGRDPDAELLPDTAAWILARDVALQSSDEALAGIDVRVDDLATALHTLSGQLGDNARSAEEVLGFAGRFAQLRELPRAAEGERVRANAMPEKSVDEAVRAVAPLETLLHLAAELDERKRRRGVVEYSDQVRFALEIVRAAPALAATHRGRAHFVLLDEYQDTSSVQVALLATLFRDAPVMAVGDPNQSIYGWRGASAGTLARFHADFGAGATFALSTSWRNPVRVLDIANTIAAPLPDAGVSTLHPRSGAPEGGVELRAFATQWEEAAAIAEWLAAAREERPDATAAMLFRARSRMPVFAAALAAAGIPHRVVGIGGLLAEPEVVDLVSALRVIAEPDAGNDLVRLLAGSRWRIGVRDLRALREHARFLAHIGVSEDATHADRASTEVDTAGSIIDALDDLADASAERQVWARFSVAARERLVDAARTLRSLRSHAGLPLTDFVRLVERTLRLDIEVAAHPVRARRRVLDAFAAHVEQFASSDARASLHALLGWLRYAADQDELPMPPEPPEPGVVQLLTIHASKGLEWDLVAVPSLSAKTLPSAPKSVQGWLRLGELPFEFRGDHDALPKLAWEASRSAHDFSTRRKQFVDEIRTRHADEERRLAYVAVTRAAEELWLSTATWVASLATAATPSVFFADAAAALGREVPDAHAPEANPGDPSDVFIQWPRDPLGQRRAAVEGAAAAVQRADPAAETAWSRTIELLLAERSRSASAPQAPERVAASAFKEWLRDPHAAATAAARPMPRKPFRATRLGTLFHAWVETRAAAAGLPDTVDDPYADDDLVGIDAERLAALQQTFLASVYAKRQPIATEIELHLPLAGATVVCKIDAVFQEGDRFVVVDWKTGALPSSAADAEERQLQLALYRTAYAEHVGVDPQRVQAELYFVEHDRIVTPDRMLSRAELEERWRAVRSALASP